MHVWGFSVDLNSVAPFLFTALLVVYGLIYVVKNTASKYFVVDASFEGGAEPAGNGSGAGMVRVEPGIVEERRCVVCGEVGTKRCSLCKAFRYCTTKCQTAHWNSGHKRNCKKVAVGNGFKNEIAQKQEKRILFSYDEFVKLYNWNYPGFPPCGLLNCGNSCFANVVLQCLTYTKPLVAYLLEKGHQRECKKAGWCFLCEFQAHVERASRSNQAFSPVNILARLPHIGGNLGFGNQEDAHEFMRFAIDSMQSVFLDQFGGEKALHPSSHETTLIHYIFGGHLLSEVKCSSCHKVSDRYESMMDLTVEIHGDTSSLEECLDQFTTAEWLDGENMYKCDGCNAYVKAWKRLSVQQPPNILTIALKRFQSGRFGKLNKRVTFPETLDLSPYMTNPVDGTDVYSLYAVVVHIDMLNASYFGHYICYIKDFRGNWYGVDDCKVVPVDLDEVFSQGAYMLLYSRNLPRGLPQMPSEPSKRPEPLEKMESCATSFQSVATTASISASSSWGVHAPVVPFSSDFGETETNDEATSKYPCLANENGQMCGLSPTNGTEVYNNGHSNQGSCLQPYRPTELNIDECSDSGCSSSADKVPETYGNGSYIQDSATSPVLGKRQRNSSCENLLNAQSPASNFQGLAAEHLIDVSDPMEISDGLGSHIYANGTLPSCGAEEQAVKRSTLNGDTTTGAYCGQSDVCNTSSLMRRRNKSSDGVFRRGFLNRNGNKIENKVDKNSCSLSSADTSPKEKLCSDVEEMLCEDVKGHMNMSTCSGKLNCDQGSPTSPVLGKALRFQNELNAQSHSSHFQELPVQEEIFKDGVDVEGRGISDHTLENGKLTSCCGEAQPMQCPTQNGSTPVNDVCNTVGSTQKMNSRQKGLFRRGFLNQSGDTSKNKVNSDRCSPPLDEPLSKNGKDCSSIADAGSSSDTSPKEKLCGDVEEMRCDNVEGNMNIFIGSDQDVMNLSKDGSLHAAGDNGKLPCAGSNESSRDIQIDVEVTPCRDNTKLSSENGCPDASSSGGRFLPR
uniref:Uncharacterized protein n=1 Tax=Kalanchoe fedtschenkoi TaxID=63787 RepID=A0A7N0R8J2_KALFE